MRKRLLRDVIPDLPVEDIRKMDVWASGLGIRRGLPLAIGATLRSVLWEDGTPIPGAEHGETTFAAAVADKIRMHPELAQGGFAAHRVQFIIAACELGGRWDVQALRLVRDLCQISVASEPDLVRRSMQVLLSRRCILACAIQRGFCGFNGRPCL